jgi:hypothetical protein
MEFSGRRKVKEMTKKDLLIIIGGIALLLFAFGMNIQGNNSPLSALECNYQCVTCENAAKVESGNELYLSEGQIITEVWVKAGQGCYIPDGVCYATVSGGVGYNYVVVEKLGDGPGCQDISHIEVCYDPATSTSTETFTQTPTSTETFTQTPTPLHEPSNTPDPSNTPSDTPTSTQAPTWTPHPPRTPNGNGRG